MYILYKSEKGNFVLLGTFFLHTLSNFTKLNVSADQLYLTVATLLLFLSHSLDDIRNSQHYYCAYSD